MRNWDTLIGLSIKLVACRGLLIQKSIYILQLPNQISRQLICGIDRDRVRATGRARRRTERNDSGLTTTMMMRKTRQDTQQNYGIEIGLANRWIDG